MKNILSVLLLFATLSVSAQKISAYYKLNKQLGNLVSSTKQIKENILNADFTIIGEYNPAENPKQKVIVFTSNTLKKIALEFKDRGALGAVLKIGLMEKNGVTTVSIANPLYMFYAYWGNLANTNQKIKMRTISNKALSILGNNLIAFGGELSEEDLAEYHYKIMMPYFTDPIDLAEYGSFKEGTQKIESNLKIGKGNTKLVYKLSFPSKNIAVYGVELKEGGEDFLSEIGEDHLAAMPYEIILQGKLATMLHGKYRLALYWPELSMGQFMRIMSTPGKIEDALESVCE